MGFLISDYPKQIPLYINSATMVVWPLELGGSASFIGLLRGAEVKGLFSASSQETWERS